MKIWKNSEILNVEKSNDHIEVTIKLSDDIEEKYREAVDIYRTSLLKNNSQNIKDFLNKHNISYEAIIDFYIGLSTEKTTESLKYYTYFEKIPNFCYQNNEGQLKDKMIDRLLFPCYATNGKHLGFLGRTLINGTKPTYLLRSDTDEDDMLFIASQSAYEALYGSNRPKEKYLVLTEGPFDAVTLFNSGIKNVIVPQARILHPTFIDKIKLADVNVIIFTDSDKYGKETAERWQKSLNKNNISAQIFSYENAIDPTEYIMKQGASAIQKLINKL